MSVRRVAPNPRLQRTPSALPSSPLSRQPLVARRQRHASTHRERTAPQRYRVPLPGFTQQARNSLIGVIAEAPGSPNRIGAQVTFTGLRSGQAIMVWPDGYGSKLSKLF